MAYSDEAGEWVLKQAQEEEQRAALQAERLRKWKEGAPVLWLTLRGWLKQQCGAITLPGGRPIVDFEVGPNTEAVLRKTSGGVAELRFDPEKFVVRAEFSGQRPGSMVFVIAKTGSGDPVFEDMNSNRIDLETVGGRILDFLLGKN